MLLAQFLELVTKYELSCFSQNDIILVPDKISLIKSIRKSPAFNFVANPEEFLSSLTNIT